MGFIACDFSISFLNPYYIGLAQKTYDSIDAINFMPKLYLDFDIVCNIYVP